jgi:hypothetical protein
VAGTGSPVARAPHRPAVLEPGRAGHCLRAARHGYFTYRVPGATIRHRLGAQQETRLLNIRCYPTHHSPERRYYKVRNALYVWSRYFRTHPRWVLQSMQKLFLEFVHIWLLEDAKLAKTRACVEGAWDFLRGRYGERGNGRARQRRSGWLGDKVRNPATTGENSRYSRPEAAPANEAGNGPFTARGRSY